MKKLKDGYNPTNFYLSPNSGLFLSKSLMEPFHEFINNEGKTKKQRAALEMSLLNIIALDDDDDGIGLPIEEEENFDERIIREKSILKILREFTEAASRISDRILLLCRDEEGGVEESKESVVRGESKEERFVIDNEFKKDKIKYYNFLRNTNKILYDIFEKNKNLIYIINGKCR